MLTEAAATADAWLVGVRGEGLLAVLEDWRVALVALVAAVALLIVTVRATRTVPATLCACGAFVAMMVAINPIACKVPDVLATMAGHSSAGPTASILLQDDTGGAVDERPQCTDGLWSAGDVLYRAPDDTCDRPDRDEKVPLTAVDGAVRVSAVTDRDIAWNLDVDEPDVLVHGDAVRVRKDGATTVYQVVSFICGPTWLVPQD